MRDVAFRPVATDAIKAIGVDDKLGIVFGWAIVCTIDGAPYYDLQGDYVPESAMLKAAARYMASPRPVKLMHAGKVMGTTLFCLPLTAEVALLLGIATPMTGLVVAIKPDDPALIERILAGDYLGFSIAGPINAAEEMA